MTHLALHATGQAPRRRLMPRVTPTGSSPTSRRGSGPEYPEVVRGTATRTIDGSVRELAVGLHPAATPVVVSVDEDGEVGVRAAFAPVGPGYHTFVGRLVQRIGAEHGPRLGGGAGRRRAGRADGPGPGGRPSRRGARLPDLARQRADRRPRRPAAWRGNRPSRDARRDPLPGRRGDRDEPRAARRRVAGGRRRRLAAGDRRHAVVGRRDRRPVPAEPGPVPDVDRGPLAPAGRRRRAARPRGGPPPAGTGLPARPVARLPVAGVARAGAVPRRRRRDDPPGRGAGAAGRGRAADRLPARPRAGPARGLGARGPGQLQRAADGRRVDRSGFRPLDHDRGHRDRHRIRPHERPGVPRPGRDGPRRRRAAPRRRRGRRASAAVDRRDVRRRSRRARGLLGRARPRARRSGSSSTTRPDWRWALDTWRALAPSPTELYARA